ncbi:hypothetical protein [Bacteroides timonensis]|uniref:hypothetical protein n=1 Tax=Bacteroides timonensis TaxID=1470345 RepID=UPI0004BA1A39|nr:hypothetical protein [Bacteroides timonensis]
MKNEEKKAKALEDEKKVQSSQNVTPEKEEDIISNDDAEKLEGGVGFSNGEDELSKPCDSVFGVVVCCG